MLYLEVGRYQSCYGKVHEVQGDLGDLAHKIWRRRVSERVLRGQRLVLRTDCEGARKRFYSL
jgi:hypothetical protein